MHYLKLPLVIGNNGAGGHDCSSCRKMNSSCSCSYWVRLAHYTYRVRGYGGMAWVCGSMAGWCVGITGCNWWLHTSHVTRTMYLARGCWGPVGNKRSVYTRM